MSVLNFTDKIVTHRWKDPLRSYSELQNFVSFARRNSVELCLMPLKGPHKFSSATYPKPTRALFSKLVNLILVKISEIQSEKTAEKLKQLIHEVDLDCYMNVFIFLLLISDIHTNRSVLGTVRIPVNLFGDKPNTERRDVPRYPTFESCKLLDYLDESVISTASKVNSWAVVQQKNNFFMNRMNFASRKPIVSNFFGAFTHLGKDAQAALSKWGSAPLRIPPLLQESGWTFSEVSKILSREELKDDVSYSASPSSWIRLSLANDNVCRHSLRSFLDGATPGVCQFVLDSLYPFRKESSFHFGRVPSSMTGDCNKRFCWTARGVEQGAKELPFLTECGHWGAAALISLQSEHASAEPCNQIQSPADVQDSHPLFSSLIEEISGKLTELRAALFRDVLLLRMSVQSSRFVWKIPPESNPSGPNEPLIGSFFYNPDPLDHVVLGVSGTALENLLNEHLVCGTYHRRLSWFARQMIPLTPSWGPARLGSSWACFASALTLWLQSYEEVLQIMLQDLEKSCMSTGEIPKSLGLLGTSHHLRLLSDRISFVAELCTLTGPSPTVLRLTSIGLLDYLYSKCEQFMCDPAEPIVRFLFKRTCQPFLNFLEHLIVDGTCDDASAEFNLSVSIKGLLKRNVTSWTDSFNLRTSELSKIATPVFVNLLPVDFERQILRCAKSVALLKSVSPNHAILKNRSRFPRLRFPASFRDFRSQQKAMERYLEYLSSAALPVPVQKPHSIHSVAQSKPVGMPPAPRDTFNELSIEGEFSVEPAIAYDDHGSCLLPGSFSAEQISVPVDAATSAVSERINGTRITTERDSAGDGKCVQSTLQRVTESCKIFDESKTINENSSFVSFRGDEDPSILCTPSTDGPILCLASEKLFTNMARPNSTSPLTPPSPRFVEQSACANVSKNQMRDLLYPGIDGQSNERNSASSGVASHTSIPPESVSRFRHRNRYGHSSNSVLQNLLYGAGSGPACRPSKWEADRVGQDSKITTSFAPQDAIAFYQEALESGTSKTLAFTKDFGDLDQPILVDPFAAVKGQTQLSASSSDSGFGDSLETFEVVPTRMLLDMTTVAVLTPYIRYVDRVLCDQFYRFGLVGHLRCLRQVCFLQNGEFCQCLLDGLFDKALLPMFSHSDVFNPNVLHDLMQNASKKFLLPVRESIDNPIGDNFEVQTTHPPIDLILTPDTTDGINFSKPSRMPFLFDRLNVFYSAPWPVNIVLTSSSMAKYNLIFRQLIRVKFAAWLLNKAYFKLRRTYLLRPSSELPLSTVVSGPCLHAVSLWLHEMIQVICGLALYLSNQAVKANWAKFVHYLTGSTQQAFAEHCLDKRSIQHVDDMIAAHEDYLDQVIRCSLLGPTDSELQKVFVGLLSCIHRFYEVLVTGRWVFDVSLHPNHTGWDQLHAAHQGFRRHARFIWLRARRLVSTYGENRHKHSLSQLVLALGLNDFYSS